MPNLVMKLNFNNTQSKFTQNKNTINTQSNSIQNKNVTSMSIKRSSPLQINNMFQKIGGGGGGGGGCGCGR